MPEVPWEFSGRLPRAHLREGYKDFMPGCKFLNFEGPNQPHVCNDGSIGDGRMCPGDFHECIWVTEGSTATLHGRNVWHYEVNGDIITVKPSIHFVGHFHSPNPVQFTVDETKFWEQQDLA